MNPTNEEIEKAFEEAWKARVKSDGLGPSALHKELHADGYKAGAKAEREKVLGILEAAAKDGIRYATSTLPFNQGQRVEARRILLVIDELKQETK